MSHLVGNNIWMWRRIECTDGLQDVVSQVGQIDKWIGHHRLYIGCTSHQKRDGGGL